VGECVVGGQWNCDASEFGEWDGGEEGGGSGRGIEEESEVDGSGEGLCGYGVKRSIYNKSITTGELEGARSFKTMLVDLSILLPAVYYY
jgi:hypothetical protein